MGRVGDEQLDPHLLFCDLQRQVDRQALPEGRTVVAITFTDDEISIRAWWLILEPGDVEVFDTDPGHDVDLHLRTDLRTLVEVWLGHQSWSEAQDSGALDVSGPHHLRIELPHWLHLSPFAPAARMSASRVEGRNRRGHRTPRSRANPRTPGQAGRVGAPTFG